MRGLSLMRLLHPEPRDVASDLCMQCSAHPNASCSPSTGDDTFKKVKLCLSESHLQALPNAQEKVCLCVRTDSLRASHARWQLLLLGPGQGSLAKPGGAHRELYWFGRPY